MATKSKTIGFVKTSFGKGEIIRSSYTNNNAVAVMVNHAVTEEPLWTLSVNILNPWYQLKENEFFVKTWSENEEIVRVCKASGLFEDTGERELTGYCEAEVWKIVG